MRETLTFLLANNTDTDQAAGPHSLISAFVIHFLKSKVTRSDISKFSICFGGLQHDKASGYAPGIIAKKNGFIMKFTSTVTKMILTSGTHHIGDFGSDL